MSKYESLMRMKEAWGAPDLSLFGKAARVSGEFYRDGMDLQAASAFIGATPAELGSLLALSELDDSLLQKISDARPPKTVWMMLAKASEEETMAAVVELADGGNEHLPGDKVTVEERLYSAMKDASGPSVWQAVGNLSSEVILAMRERARAYKALPDNEMKFLNSIASLRKYGKALTPKQTKWLVDILTRLVDGKVIKRDGIDDDQAYCDEVLDIFKR